MKKWQIENSENSEISEILFRVFLFPSFQFCLTAKIENSVLKISEKNFRDFRDFRVFRVFDLAKYLHLCNIYFLDIYSNEFFCVYRFNTQKISFVETRGVFSVRSANFDRIWLPDEGREKILNEVIYEIETWTLSCYSKKDLLLKLKLKLKLINLHIIYTKNEALFYTYEFWIKTLNEPLLSEP